MSIRIVWGCAEEDLMKAQWRLIQQLQALFTQGLGHREARQQVHAACQLLQTAATPHDWLRAFSVALLQLLEERYLDAEAAWQVGALQEQCEALQARCRSYEQDPLQGQVTALRQEHDHWRTEAEERAQQQHAVARELSQALQREQQERARLQKEIRQLNEIIVQQQSALSAREA
ncbi:MAG: hypothetical protein U9Q70_11770 [Chloroflexota bacterium]|nr:hypothetical protein [Chloroflexota bacterium]